MLLREYYQKIHKSFFRLLTIVNIAVEKLIKIRKQVAYDKGELQDSEDEFQMPDFVTLNEAVSVRIHFEC